MPRSLPAAIGTGLSDGAIATIAGEVLIGIVTDGLDVPLIFTTIAFDAVTASNRMLVLSQLDHLVSIANNFLSLIKNCVELGIDIKNLLEPKDTSTALYCEDKDGNKVGIACILQAISDKLTFKDVDNLEYDLTETLFLLKEDLIFKDETTGREYPISETLGRLLLTGYLVPR